MTVYDLPHVNAVLNATAIVLLLVGLWMIRRGRETAHKRTMLTCFAVSVAFLICYLTYHHYARHVPFPDGPPQWIRWTYYTILLTHVLLAMLVPILAVVTIVLGLRDQRAAHRKWAKVTFPIWLYVSATGLVIYLMLYQIYAP